MFALLFALTTITPRPGCTFMTDIPEFVEKAQDEGRKACGDKYIRAVSVLGDMKHISVTITYNIDLEGEQIAQTDRAKAAGEAAKLGYGVWKDLYHPAFFSFRFRDTKERDLCWFEFLDSEPIWTKAQCVSYVGPTK